MNELLVDAEFSHIVRTNFSGQVNIIVRDGNTLILNTRSSRALIRAGIPRSSWNVIDRTGQAAYEGRLSGQLSRNGLTSYGTELP